MFADAAPDANALKTILNVTQYIAMWIIAIAGAVAVFRKPQRQERDVRMVSDSVPKEEFDRHVELTNQTLEKLARDSDERRRAIYEKLEKLGDRVGADVTQVREHGAGLEKGFELLDQRMVLMDQKLDSAIERRRAM